jgi:hypothetical protein
VKSPLEGGLPVELAQVSGFAGAAWGDDGSIIVGSTAGLMRVSDAGGVPRPLTDTGRPEAFPDILPGGGSVLYNTSDRPVTNLEEVDIHVLDLSTGESKPLVRAGYWPRYLRTSGRTGHLVFIRGGTLYGVAFDPVRLAVRGMPVPLVDDVASSASVNEGGGQFASSADGTLVYLTGTPETRLFPLHWLEASGTTGPLVAEPDAYVAPRLSPDGQRLAYKVRGANGPDLWVYDIGRQTPTQITFDAPGDLEVAWAPDSKHVVFSDSTTLWWVSADGAGRPVKLLDGLVAPRPGAVAPDGRLAFAHGGPRTYGRCLSISTIRRGRRPERPNPSWLNPMSPKSIPLFTGRQIPGLRIERIVP